GGRLLERSGAGHTAGAPAAGAGRASHARGELGRRIDRDGEATAGAGLCDLGRRVEPARAAGMVCADGGHQARPRSLSRRGQAINDLVAGHVRVAFLGPTALIPHYKSGNLRLLAQSSETRSPNLPEVPTLQEAGFKGLVLETWYAAF